MLVIYSFFYYNKYKKIGEQNMNKKGFTLAELLGVITILAMLALLVTPVVT